MKIIASNSRANYDYSFSQKIEAGIVLTGPEVKSLRHNASSIRGSYILEKNGELWIANCHIKKYHNSNIINYDPNRFKKLLVSKKEYFKVIGLLKQGGLSLIPISLYFNNKGLAKIIFGLGKGKKKFDKRHSIKEKDWNKKKERLLKKN
tara:strand:- start:623 stop:1069 length:447 start_codon:yes stop_codon:yes gene_type:complete